MKQGHISICFNSPSFRPTHRYNNQRLLKFVQKGPFFPQKRLSLNHHVIRFSRNPYFSNKIQGSTINHQGKQITREYFSKMYVDGWGIEELGLSRPAQTQVVPRKHMKNRIGSPDVKPKQQQNSFQLDFPLLRMLDDQLQAKINSSNVFNKERIDQSEPNSPLVNTVDLTTLQPKQQDFKSIDKLTQSSSHRHHFTIKIKKTIKAQQNEQKQSLSLKKELAQTYSSPLGWPQNISAKAYVVYEHKVQSKGCSQHKGEKKNQQQLPDRKNSNIAKGLKAACNSKIKMEIASLTKIMTCAIVLQVAQKMQLNLAQQTYEIGSFQTKVQGTSAQLKPGQAYTIHQLLYGMMLPSGNDASIALAVYCGRLLQSSKQKPVQSPKQKMNDLKALSYRRFVGQMNKKCMQLGMKRTFFTNSHGLTNSLNRACVSDVVLMINYALGFKVFRQVVQCSTYITTIKYSNHKQDQYRSKQKQWQNTHKLVKDKPHLYKGIKTGITQSAGPCLASLLKVNGREFIIVVLNSKSMKARFKDTQKLKEWLFKKEGISQEKN